MFAVFVLFLLYFIIISAWSMFIPRVLSSCG